MVLGYYCNAQVQCPKIEEPLDGDTNVAVDTRVSWNTVQGIDGYSVSLGTSPGASDILNSRSAALVNFLEPMVGLPDNTEIFVTISLFLKDGTFVTCPTERFTTVDVTTPPDCTNLTGPIANAQDVKLSETIVWAYAPTATGYKVAIGTSSDSFEILPETDLGNVLRYEPPENLPISSEIFIKLTPYNDNGDAEACSVESFTTGKSNIDCEQFRPEIDMPETFGLCLDRSEIVISTDDVASGFHWYAVANDGTQRLIGEGRTITLADIGRYRYEAYNDVSISGDTAECSSSTFFSVIASEIATVEAVEVERNASEINLTVLVQGGGNYEYSIGENGTYQNSNVLYGIPEGNQTIYVRDKNGCGVTRYEFIQTITKDDFPKFFTPNNDNTNDYWQFSPVYDTTARLDLIYIFDRFGRLLLFIDPESRGWDGMYQGKPVPSSTYWYKAVAINGDEFQGYFALKR